MSGAQFFSFPTIDEVIEMYLNDEDFQASVSRAFDGVGNSVQLRRVLESAYDNVDEDQLQCLTIALDEPMSLSGIAIPSVGPQALMVAVYCRNGDLVTRFKTGSGGFLDLVRTAGSGACITGG